MSEYVLDTNLIARLVFALLPHKPPYRLALDRTNWKFGATNINILVLAVVYQGDAFPILFTMMPKFGNSSTSERIELMQRYIGLLESKPLPAFWPTGSSLETTGWLTITSTEFGTI